MLDPNATDDLLEIFFRDAGNGICNCICLFEPIDTLGDLDWKSLYCDDDEYRRDESGMFLSYLGKYDYTYQSAKQQFLEVMR